MPLPPQLTLVTVHGKYVKPDGTAESGTVTFAPTTPVLQVPAADTILAPTRIEATLDSNGEFTTTLIATNDPDATPSGWTYVVAERLTTLSRDRVIEVPYTTVGTLQLADIADAVPAPAVVTYALQAALVAEEAARIAADALKASIASVTPGSWLAFTLNSGAGAPVTSPLITAAAGRIESPVSGRVGLRGAIGISGAGFTQGAIIGQVHADLRPTEPRVGVLRTRGATSTHTNWLVAVNGDFSVTNTALLAGSDVPLDGVTYTL